MSPAGEEQRSCRREGGKEEGREGSLRQPLDLLHPCSRCTAEPLRPLPPGLCRIPQTLRVFFPPPRLLNPFGAGKLR